MSDAQFFVYKLISPRPTFPMDMTDAERAAMGAHGAYWRELLDARRAVVYGPVMDPAGVWGLAVVEARSADEVRAIGGADPAVTSGVASFDVFPMMNATVRA
ncbi:YciI family protein [Roseisolibacter sp. H3M3-2]|uniref:YciI family protein n=1 Tax=Roseisolibacter sp. H3M3-2 TaxID=3031323 RepID=UPI0023DB59CB|nr:YciI family protein [Roseisolibacter sp. H3M3-2]MDF1506443.1 YciI family protein [Roseisolibacter sp. H3M3-2]